MRSLRLLAALALTVTATFTATTAEAADGTGDLSVTMVDFQGNPATGLIQVVGPEGFTLTNVPGVSSHTFALDPATYGVLGVTPWGGISCAGLESCDYISIATGHALPNGDIVVTSGGTETATLHSERPAKISGPRVVGSPLLIDYSEGLDQLYSVFAGGGVGLLPSVEWLRDGKPIAGATGQTYVPTGADTGKNISARLTYASLGLGYMQQLTGSSTIPSVTTPPVSVAKKKAQTFIRMMRDVITARQRGAVRVDVTSPGSIVAGKVRIAVGDWVATRVLRNGRVAVQLPPLGPGTYPVTASFLGSGEYAASKAKPKTLKVTR